jgi:hypothetical protein
MRKTDVEEWDMFGLFRLFGRTVVVTAATLAGNWVGEQVRAQVTGETGHQLRMVQKNEQGETLIAANPLLSNLLPGLLIGLFRSPHWLWAFIGGAIASGVLGDRYEAQFMELVDRQVSPTVKKVTERIPMKP